MRRMQLLYFAVGLLVVLVSSLIFALRFTPAFHDTNFYAEDGRVFTQNVLQKNPIATAATGFNGYLVVGQYGLVEMAVFVNSLLGRHFVGLPVMLAITSCLFLGLTVSLPFLLLRKQIGTVLSLAMVLLGALTPLPSSDYAIIGTIGNLKFAALYWVFLLVLFRNYNFKKHRLTFVVDAVIFICVLTYAPATALLPFALWPYRNRIREVLSKRNLKKILSDSSLRSLIALGVLCFLYLVTVYIKGIPSLKGYLDAPYDPVATLKLIFHATWYTWLFPIAQTMRDRVMLGLLLVTALMVWRHKENRFIGIFALWSIAIATVSFAINRTGVSSFFLAYGPGPDQFYYAQRLVFMFFCVWSMRSFLVNSRWVDRSILAVAFLVFLFWATPFSGSFGKNSDSYRPVGSIQHNLKTACRAHQTKINLQTYPSSEWIWKVDRNTACQ